MNFEQVSALSKQKWDELLVLQKVANDLNEWVSFRCYLEFTLPECRDTVEGSPSQATVGLFLREGLMECEKEFKLPAHFIQTPCKVHVEWNPGYDGNFEPCAWAESPGHDCELVDVIVPDAQWNSHGEASRGVWASGSLVTLKPLPLLVDDQEDE